MITEEDFVSNILAAITKIWCKNLDYIFTACVWKHSRILIQLPLTCLFICLMFRGRNRGGKTQRVGAIWSAAASLLGDVHGAQSPQVLEGLCSKSWSLPRLALKFACSGD